MTLLSFTGRKAPGRFDGLSVTPFRINPITKVLVPKFHNKTGNVNLCKEITWLQTQGGPVKMSSVGTQT